MSPATVEVQIVALNEYMRNEVVHTGLCQGKRHNATISTSAAWSEVHFPVTDGEQTRASNRERLSQPFLAARENIDILPPKILVYRK